MRQTPRRALATLALALGFVVAQPSLRIGLGETLQGTLLIVGWHDYALEVPAGVSAILVSVDARGRDADLAVYGPGGNQLFRDVSGNPYPAALLTGPFPGTYQVRVLNLTGAEMRYRLTVRVRHVELKPVSDPWDFYLALRVSSVGLSENQMRDAIARGLVGHHDVVWRKGLGVDGAWVHAGALPEFAGTFPAAGPPAPPVPSEVTDADATALPLPLPPQPPETGDPPTTDQLPTPTLVRATTPTAPIVGGSISAPGCAYGRHGNELIECAANQPEPAAPVDVFWTVNGQVVANYTTNATNLPFNHEPTTAGTQVISLHVRFADGSWGEGTASVFVPPDGSGPDATDGGTAGAGGAGDCDGVLLFGVCAPPIPPPPDPPADRP